MSAAPSASVRLGRKLELLVPAFGTPGRLLIEHPRARELVVPYLAAGSYVTIVMVPLMEVALERARARASADGVAAGLVGYLERHIPEEMHGDVPGGAALADLAALGGDTEAVRLQPLPEKIAALIGTLYFRIVHAHPVAILGLLWLESYPPDRPSIERLMERTRLPDDGFRQLLLHAEVDLHHGKALREVIDVLPLEPWHEQLIMLTAFQTMSFFVHAWLGVLDGADERLETSGEPGPRTRHALRAGDRVAPE
jgi:hypothetical protein